MPDASDINDSLATDAEAGIQRTRIGQEEVELMSVDDRIKVANRHADTATNGIFGVRIVSLLPPGANR